VVEAELEVGEEEEVEADLVEVFAGQVLVEETFEKIIKTKTISVKTFLEKCMKIFFF